MGAFGTDGLLLALVALLYTALWSGILTATAVAARSLREATLSYGGVWVLLVILAPALQSELAFSKVADDPGLQGALDTRKEQYETYDTDLPLLVDELYRARPELVSMPLGFLDEVPRSATRHVYDWHRLQYLRSHWVSRDCRNVTGGRMHLEGHGSCQVDSSGRVLSGTVIRGYKCYNYTYKLFKCTYKRSK